MSSAVMRFNIGAPFPSLVNSSGPITIAKTNGIWTVGFSTANLGAIAPAQASYPTDLLLVYDSIAQTYSNISFLNLLRFDRFMAGSASVNFNAGNADTSIALTLPSANYRIVQVLIANASASISTATWGLFSATGGGGTAIFAAGQALTVVTASTNTNNNMQTATPANANTESFNFTTLFFRVGTAQGSPATATVYIWVEPLT